MWLDDLQNRFLMKPLIFLEKNDGILAGIFEGKTLKFPKRGLLWHLSWMFVTGVKETPLAKRDSLRIFSSVRHSVSSLRGEFFSLLVEGGPSFSLQSNEISSDTDEAGTW